MVGEWIAEPRKNGYYGGPSLKTRESQSCMVNHHEVCKDAKDVSANYRANELGMDGFPSELSGDVYNGQVRLSKNQARKMRKYGKTPREYRTANGIDYK